MVDDKITKIWLTSYWHLHIHDYYKNADIIAHQETT